MVTADILATTKRSPFTGDLLKTHEKKVLITAPENTKKIQKISETEKTQFHRQSDFNECFKLQGRGDEDK